MRAAVQSAHLIQREAGMRPALSRPQKGIGREFSTPTRAQSSPAEVAADEPIPPGCSRYTVRICKPLGIVLEETDGLLRVGDVQAGGNAERHNETANADSIIRTNDQLIAVSGYTRTGQAQVRDRIRALIHSFNSLAHSLTLAVLRGCSLARCASE